MDIENLENENNETTDDERQCLLPRVPRESFFSKLGSLVTCLWTYPLCVDFVVLFFWSATHLIDVIMINAFETQYCIAVLNRSQADCVVSYRLNVAALIPPDNVVIYAINMQTVRTIFEVVTSCVLAFVAGPWSDKYGRKPLFILSILGNIIRCGLYAVVSHFPTINPLWYLVSSTPYAIVGGRVVFSLASYCYIGDVVPEESRNMRFVFLQFMNVLSGTIAFQAGPRLKENGFTAVFLTATALALVSFLLAVFRLQESVIRTEDSNTIESRNPIKWRYFVELKNACWTNQRPKVRQQILLTFIIVFVALVAEYGDYYILYVFMQKVLNIELSAYGQFLTAITVSINFGQLLCTYIFSSVLQVSDLKFLGCAALVKCVSVFFTAFGNKLWYLFTCRVMANGSLLLLMALSRAHIPKIVFGEQLGKVFALLPAFEGFAEPLGNSLYTTVFNNTIDIFPGAVFLLSGFLMIFDLLLIMRLMKIYIRYKHEEVFEPNVQEPPSIL